jgi:tRNA(fMet)-specific endonuclease VapC
VRFLLDTSTCVFAIKRRPDVLARLRELGPQDVALSSITLAELWFGAAKSSRPEQTRRNVDAFLLPFTVLPFEREAAGEYARIRLALESVGRPIGERDLLIASIAASRRLTVVTHNRKEFARVPGLRIEDWVAES